MLKIRNDDVCGYSATPILSIRIGDNVGAFSGLRVFATKGVVFVHGGDTC
jgi:hypothetical protein